MAFKLSKFRAIRRGAGHQAPAGTNTIHLGSEEETSDDHGDGDMT